MVEVLEKVKVEKSGEKHQKKYCLVCGGYIIRKKGKSWYEYSKRKYCGNACLREMRIAKGGKQGDNKDESAISDYIEVKTRNGRLMADFNIGVLTTVEKIKDDVDDNGKKGGVICVYKGVPVTGDIVNKANDWLMNNWKGKPGQRSGEVEKAEMTREEVLAGLRSMESR